MRYLSVCSGIEAASCAWHPLGWTPVAFAEIEAFPSAVLAHHYPNVPNWGDLTKFKDWPDATIDLLVGGTPCQSFSVAGLRKGLADPRGNLALTYLALADKYRPEWLVWENVPGVLSADGGEAFGAFLGGLGELGYGWAYRVLDAQYWGLAQRRKRVFVVASLGGWQRAAAVLFDSASLRGDSAPSREAREGVAPSLAARTKGGGGLGTDAECDGALIPVIAGCLNSAGGHAVPGNSIQDSDQGYLIPEAPPVSFCLNAGGMGRIDAESETLIPIDAAIPIQNATRGEDQNGLGVGGDVMFTLDQASQHAIAFDTTQITSAANYSNPKAGDPCHPLAAGAHAPAITVAASIGQRMRGQDDSCADNLQVAQGMQVRRLTPQECERLQGFPDDYTVTPYRGKPAADGPRYKALGNSMAVPVMRWIGQRIQQVANIKKVEAA